MADTKNNRRKATSGETWSDIEKQAMRETARERKASAKLSPAEQRAAGEADVMARMAEMSDHDRAMAERLYAMVSRVAPNFTPRTFYGMPAWSRDGKTVCFFQPASKFKVRYSTFGFQPDAKLDDGSMWAASFALLDLTDADEAKLAELVAKAAS